MKRLLTIIVSLLFAIPGIAQKQSFQFFYIAHDRGTPVNDLCDRLKYAFETAIYDEEYAVVFYLPNFDRPMTVVVNLPDDNRKDFDMFLAELRLKSYHEVYSELDYKNILDLINKYDFIDANGFQTYSSVEFNWYVNPDFWMMKHNEELIASLYFTLEIEKHQDYVSFQIWHAKDDGLDRDVDMENPFGKKDLCNAMPFLLLPY